MILTEGLHETFIGDFVNRHPEIIYNFFGGSHHVYEPTLKWIQHDGTVERRSINPDLFIRRSDGFYDIVDFKLGRPDKARLTKGRRERRSFSSYIDSGIHQLVHYDEYFSYEDNASYALQEHGIVVHEPNLYLIVGNRENLPYYEKAQALEAYRDRINIIDYESLLYSTLLRNLNK